MPNARVRRHTGPHESLLDSMVWEVAAANRDPKLEVESPYRREKRLVVPFRRTSRANKVGRRRGSGTPKALIDRLQQQLEFRSRYPEPRCGDLELGAAIADDRAKVRMDLKALQHEGLS